VTKKKPRRELEGRTLADDMIGKDSIPDDALRFDAKGHRLLGKKRPKVRGKPRA